MAAAAGVTADTANHIETVWSKLKDPLLDAANEVCGPRTTSGHLKPVGGMNS